MLLIYTHLAQEVESEKVKDNRCCAKVCKGSSNGTSAMASETIETSNIPFLRNFLELSISSRSNLRSQTRQKNKLSNS